MKRVDGKKGDNVSDGEIYGEMYCQVCVGSFQFRQERRELRTEFWPRVLSVLAV